MPVYTYTTLNDPLATGGTNAYGINDLGQIVGEYGGDGGFHGFLYSGGTYVTLDDPLASGITLTPATIPTASSIAAAFTPPSTLPRP